MNLKKLLIPCIVAITLFGTAIIPSTVVNAATSCPIYGEIVGKGENHTHRYRAVQACPICGERVYPGQNHVCSW
ncbi:hypothetical protein EXN65_15550 [Clostridium botulinum]|uniref:hypothetical protein n=1 Tax=Clostridium botulinum TaxID=1491 RepID=UPI00016BAAE1|nr:hypothetical protein [Clostridium botulinum]EDT84212.1 putative lipoprotein [Clostridium botulinum Bf]MBY6880960.1 hypothetical protein [Clostridium botulinum]NEZ88449.1 hypothetical protein [Clostridium botulinum]NFB02042.1 hypothetical protein [Clostridium botulinum]NFE31845.1 hypothetical protein [Clostridium botulinum]